LVIDFTHEIEQKSGFANQERWNTRLKTIESRWGARGADTLWCAPTAEVSDYVHAARAAKVTVAGEHLCPIIPSFPAIIGTGIVVSAAEPLKAMSVWAIDDDEVAFDVGLVEVLALPSPDANVHLARLEINSVVELSGRSVVLHDGSIVGFRDALLHDP
jgi:hypothetical protein